MVFSRKSAEWDLLRVHGDDQPGGDRGGKCEACVPDTGVLLTCADVESRPPETLRSEARTYSGATRDATAARRSVGTFS
jgi:hypothetical protein